MSANPNPNYNEKVLGTWTPTEELIAQGALDLRALGFNVDSNATRPPQETKEATPVPAKPGYPSKYEEGISFLDAAIARAGGEQDSLGLWFGCASTRCGGEPDCAQRWRGAL